MNRIEIKDTLKVAKQLKGKGHFYFQVENSCVELVYEPKLEAEVQKMFEELSKEKEVKVVKKKESKTEDKAEE